jgi:hypothetical protein
MRRYFVVAIIVGTLVSAAIFALHYFGAFSRLDLWLAEVFRAVGFFPIDSADLDSATRVWFERGVIVEGAGFEVINLGINNSVEKYLDALDSEKPDILGMSALLTTTMPYMKVVIDALKEKGIRDDYVVMVGGAPLNEEFGKAIGADAYCRDAAVAVETAKDFMFRKNNSLAAGAG